MLGARTFVLMGPCQPGPRGDRATAQSLFNFPLSFPGSPPAPNPQTFLPPDANPNYSTPGGYDNEVDMAHTTRTEVNDPTGQPAGTSRSIRANASSISRWAAGGRCNMGSAWGAAASPGRAKPRSAEIRSGPDGSRRRK